MADKLNDKQKRFVDEYLIDLNATQAAIRAGYNEKNARVVAAQNLSKLNIQQYLQERRKKQIERNEVTQDKVLAELVKIGFKEAADYTDADLKYSNKLRALELLMKHLGMFDMKKSDTAEIEDLTPLVDMLRNADE